MRILVAWDDPSEAELLSLYLSGGGENDVHLAESPANFEARAGREGWDALCLSICYPTSTDEGFQLFCRAQELLPGVPVLAACRPTEMINLPRFLMRGLRFYVYRDPAGDFLFLVLSTLESAVQACQADAARRLADHLREEINGVRLLQEAIIPHGLQPPSGYRVAARYEPAQISTLGGQPVVLAGGDYYDLFRPDDTTLIALVGDASGHGLKACMSIMTMHTLVRMLAGNRFRDTASFVTEINRMLCANSIVQSGGGFITLLYAAVDTQAHRVSWTSAGHPPALLHHLETDEVTQVGTSADGGLPLGITDGMDYDAAVFEMPPNSRLLLYSDGLPDALPPGADTGSEAAFGVEGISQALRQCRKRSLDEALEYLFEVSSAYTGGQGRHDDTSVLLLERS